MSDRPDIERALPREVADMSRWQTRTPWWKVPGVVAWLESEAIDRAADQELRQQPGLSEQAALIAACRRFGVRIKTHISRVRRWLSA
jgi:hypothetical protein